MTSPDPCTTRRALVIAPAVLALAACAGNPPTATQDFGAWAEQFAADWVRLSAEMATQTQYFGSAEQAAFDRQLTPQTGALLVRQRALARAGLARLARTDDAALSPPQRVDAALLRWSLQRTLAGAPFVDHGFVFNQMFGAQVRYVALLSETQPLNKPADIGAYLDRLAQVPPRLD